LFFDILLLYVSLLFVQLHYMWHSAFVV